MKKTILTLLLVAMSTGVMAEWVMAGSGSTFEHYVDPATIRKNGNTVKMWVMYENREPKVEPFGTFSSIKAQEEYDCSGERNRSLATVFYSGRMGNGKVISSESNTGRWAPITPESVNETQWKIACGKIKLK